MPILDPPLLPCTFPGCATVLHLKTWKQLSCSDERQQRAERDFSGWCARERERKAQGECLDRRQYAAEGKLLGERLEFTSK